MAKMKNINKDWLDTSKRMPMAITGHISRKFEDVAYGEDDLQQMDIYLPETGDGPFPVVLNVHGGGMLFGDKRDFHLYPMFYALERGFAVAAVNYRLSPAVKYPTQLYDVKRAILWLSDHSKTYSIDKNNMFLWGTSAGGNLVLMGGLKKGMEMPDDLKRADQIPIRGVAAMCAEIDMSKLNAKGGKWRERMFLSLMMIGHYAKVLGVKEPTPELLGKTNPATCLSSGIAPLYMQHGDQDYTVPVSQTLEFAEAAKKVLGKDDLIVDIIEGASHAGNGSEFLMPENVLPVLEFFERHIEA